MADDESFLHLLAERPDDLDTLGVYADWLEERGHHPRAELLRIQQRLAAATDRPTQIENARALVKLAPSTPADWLARIARPPLANTCWEGTSDGKPITLRFLPNGVLNYTQYGSTYQNGTWLQVGSAVACETNRHYADYTGAITHSTIVGVAHNIANSRWDWQVAFTSDPTFVDVKGPVVTTVFDDHIKRREKAAREAARQRAAPPAAAKKPTPKKASAKPALTKPAATAAKRATTKPAATKPTATKPTATKPTATKPTATKPAATKPIATKPTATKRR